MKSIVFVIGNYKNGGVAMRATNLANEFAKNGYKATILVTKEAADNVFFEHHKNVSVVSLNKYPSEHIISKQEKELSAKRKLRIRFFKYARYISRFFPKSDKKLAAEIRGIRCSESISAFIANNPDSIYIPFGIACFENVFYGSKGTKAKIVYAERNAPERELPQDKSERERIIRILSKADGAVLQTKTELDFYNGRLKNAIVINNPVKANLPEPFDGERRKTVVNFCRISKQKNLPLLINAFIEFHKTYSDYTLEIYGNTVENHEDELKEEYINLISSLNAEEYIKILPPRGDVHSVVRDCALFVSSSDFEGLSNSMIEAMAVGLPCICTDCLGGGAREVITDGENGLLVPVNDTEALAHAMCRMVEDKALAEKCSKNAAKTREKLSAEAISDKWLEFIENN